MLAIDALPLPVLRQVLDELGAPSWREQARVEQLPPAGDWRTWLIMAGRGWGKTRTGAEAINEWVRDGKSRAVSYIGQTAADLRKLIEPAIIDASTVPIADFNQSSHTIKWANGAKAFGFSAEDPDSLRGYQADTAWLDEVLLMRSTCTEPSAFFVA